ncbi:MAG: radical SAM protein [Verrucomicrobia bacterium]|nr:radical SAM protein [Verrucomicrobiota bacterium]
MNVTFINLRHNIYDLHGIYSLAGSLRECDVRVNYADASRDSGLTIERMKANPPSVVCYSAMECDVPRYIEFDRALKSSLPKVVSVIGGAGPTFHPEQTKDSTINAYCIGEGEKSLAGFCLNGFKQFGNIRKHGEPMPNLMPLADLDSLPFPDRMPVYDVDALLRYAPKKQFMSGRGCPFTCTYCHNRRFNAMFGLKIRKKSVDYLIEEILSVRIDYGLSELEFQDDQFIADRKWLAEFAEKYAIRIGLPYTCNASAPLVNDDVAFMLKESGCVGVCWSIESGVDSIRRHVLNRRMSNEDILGCAESLRKHGIWSRIGNLIGLPGETPDDMFKTLELNIACRPYLAVANIFAPYPGLKITRDAIEQGIYTPGKPLPHTVFQRSLLNFSAKEHEFIVKLMLLFGLLVRWPRLYQYPVLRRFMFGLPVLVLRLLREVMYLKWMSKVHSGETGLAHKLKVFWRYLASPR